MKISGNDLIFLIQVLRDSLGIERGYDWQFKSTKDQREKFLHLLISKIFNQEKIDVENIDLKSLRL